MRCLAGIVRTAARCVFDSPPRNEPKLTGQLIDTCTTAAVFCSQFRSIALGAFAVRTSGLFGNHKIHDDLSLIAGRRKIVDNPVVIKHAWERKLGKVSKRAAPGNHALVLHAGSRNRTCGLVSTHFAYLFGYTLMH